MLCCVVQISPPRLGHMKVGLLATRTPHRPNPIGLCLVKLDRVDKCVPLFVRS